MPKEVTHDLAQVNQELSDLKTVVIGDTFYFGDTIPSKLADALKAEGALIVKKLDKPVYTGGPSSLPEFAYAGEISGWKIDPDIIRDKFPGIEVVDVATIGDPVKFLKERGLIGKRRDRSERCEGRSPSW